MDNWVERYDAAITERKEAQLALYEAHKLMEQAQLRVENAELALQLVFAERNDLREGRNGPDDKTAPGR